MIIDLKISREGIEELAKVFDKFKLNTKSKKNNIYIMELPTSRYYAWVRYYDEETLENVDIDDIDEIILREYL